METVAARRDAVAMAFREGLAWRRLTYGEIAVRIRSLAEGLMDLGLRKGDPVLIASETRHEWNLIEWATRMAGGVVVPAFPTLPPHLLRHQAGDGGCVVAFVEDDAQLGKLEAVWKDLPVLRFAVAIEPTGREDGRRVFSLADLEERGRLRGDEAAYDARWRSVAVDDLASIIYTSGTTGLPKGVRLTHGNFVAAIAASLKLLALAPDTVNLAFLPLAHVYQMTVNLGIVYVGGQTAYGSPRTVPEDLVTTRPTVFAAVPRFYERLYDRILEEVRKTSPVKQRIFFWAEGVAKEWGTSTARRTPPSLGLRLRRALADRLVYRRVRAGLGGRLRLTLSGASALSPELAILLNGMGVTVLEGYGLTEAAAPTNVNPSDAIKPGTVGPPIPGVQETLGEDGEILVRGPNLFPGYHNLPEATAAAFTPDGWFRTGDLGVFDEDGYLRILGRKKHILVLSTGKNVAPAPIEERLKAHDLVEDVVVLGDNRKFTAALIQPRYEGLLSWLADHGIRPREDDVAYGENPLGERIVLRLSRRILDDPRVVRVYEGIVAAANEAFDYHEKVKRFHLVEHRFTVAREELTPTLKKRREVIARTYADAVDALYR
jgi:long-chain acyl-CoA synthetase